VANLTEVKAILKDQKIRMTREETGLT